MKKNNMSHNNSNFIRWFKSIMLLVGCMMFFFSILCGYMLSVLRKNTIQASGDFTHYVQSNMDSRLQEIQKYSSVLELHPTNSYLKKLTLPPENNNSSYQFSDQMLNYKTTNKLVDGIFIYYPDIHQIVGNLGCYSENSYYALDNLLLLNGYEAWMNSITHNANQKFVQIEAGGGEKFCYIREMKYESRIVGYIVFELNADELLSATISGHDDGPRYSSFGIMLNGALLAYTGHRDQLLELLPSISPALEESEIIEKPGSLLYVRPSLFPDLSYFNVYFQKKNLQPIYVAFSLCIAGVIICGMLGIVLSIYISRKNIRPLRSLMNKLGGSPADTADEYQIITEKIDQMIMGKFKSTEKLQKQQALIDSLFLKMVISGDMNTEYAVFNAAKRCDVIFENPCYLAAILCLGEVHETLDDVMLTEVNQYCEVHGYFTISAFYEDTMVLLFNLEETVRADAICELLCAMKKELLHNAADICALGQIHGALNQIHTSYTQAATALHCAGKSKQQNIVCYSPSMEHAADQPAPYNSAFESFTLAIYQGDHASALSLLPSVFDHYFSKEDSPEITRIKFRAVQNLLLDSKYKAKVNDKLTAVPIHTAQILSCTSQEQLRDYAEQLLKFHNTAKSTQGEAVAGVAERAKLIIQRDFTDPMLGLYLISAELGINDSYLSTTFKSKFGVGVVQYINTLRIEQAKKLICNTELSIRDIALSVGFSSDASFIRVFKRYEMQTPSTLRKIPK